MLSITLGCSYTLICDGISCQSCDATIEAIKKLFDVNRNDAQFWHVAPTHLQRAPEPLIQHPEGPNSPCWVFHPILHPSSGGPKTSQPSSSSNVNQSCCAFPVSAGLRLNNEDNSIHEQSRTRSSPIGFNSRVHCMPTGRTRAGPGDS